MPDFGAFLFHYGAVVGHYRVTWRAAIVAAQAANSRLFTLRNKNAAGGNLILPTRLMVKVLQTGAHTAAIEDSFDIYKLTGFTVDDSAGQVAPTITSKVTSAPAGTQDVSVLGVTAAGAAAGMTGGTLTKIASPLAQLPTWFLAAAPTAAQMLDVREDMFTEMGQNSAPFALAPAEGLDIENRVLLGAAAAASIYIDLAYSVVEPF
jgi:hypothetical protein